MSGCRHLIPTADAALRSTRRSRSWVLWLILTIVISPGSWPPSAAAANSDPELAPMRRFDQANQAFLAAVEPDEFAESAALFQSVVDQGGVGSAVLFNLGNAWMLAGDPGRAIAAYRQAKRLAPRDPVLESNLSMARTVAGTVAPSRSWVSRVVFWQPWTSLREKAWAVTILLASAVLLGLSGQALRRRALRRVAGLAFALTLLLGISVAVDVVQQRAGTQGVITGSQVIARKGAAESYAEAFTEPLLRATELRILGDENGWVHVLLDAGLDGWVPAEDLAVW